jgi:predicted permease
MPGALRSARRYWKLVAVSCFSLSIAMALGVLALSMSDTALLAPPSGSDADRLVTIYERAPDDATGHISYPDYQYLREHNHVFSDVAAAPNSIGLSESRDDSGRETKVVSRPVSENYFSVLGIRPYLGQLFGPGEDRKGAQEAVMTWSCWKRLGSDLHIVGKSIAGRTITGVAPPEYTGSLYGVTGDLMENLGGGDRAWQSDREAHGLVLTARLKPGVTLERAQAEMTALAGQLASAYPKEDKGRAAIVTRATLLPPDAIPDMQWITGVLVALMLLVLSIACANVANLLLAAAVGRRHEAAIKLAIGAPRGRLIRGFLMEGAALCVVSGALGYAIAAAVAAQFTALKVTLPMFGAVSTGLNLRFDGVVLALALVLVAIASLATGVAPALYASSPALAQMLGGEIVVGGTRRNARRNALVIVQIAVCTLALVGMGLGQRNLYNLRHTDLGFSARNLMAVTVFLRGEGYDEARGKPFLNTLRATTAAMPGVQSVTLASGLPLLGSSVVDLQMPGKPEPMHVGHTVVDSAYFTTIRLPILAGRAFDRSDGESAPPVAIVNRKLAETLWPGKSAVGQTLMAGKPARPCIVVGVAADSKYEALDEPRSPFLYYPLSQHYDLSVTVIARTSGDPKLRVAAFRQAMRGLGLKIAIDPVTFDQWVDLDLFFERIAAASAGILSALGLLLAMIGLLGAVSYSVGERKKELGIRVALGARQGQLLAMVLRQTAIIAGAGIAIGALLGVGATALLQSQLYRMSAVEWTVLLPVSAAMMTICLVMAYISARPWLKVDPMEAVRHA